MKYSILLCFIEYNRAKLLSFQHVISVSKVINKILNKDFIFIQNSFRFTEKLSRKYRVLLCPLTPYTYSPPSVELSFDASPRSRTILKARWTGVNFFIFFEPKCPHLETGDSRTNLRSSDFVRGVIVLRMKSDGLRWCLSDIQHMAGIREQSASFAH